jgi:hypothetical protein
MKEKARTQKMGHLSTKSIERERLPKQYWKKKSKAIAK